MTEITRLDASLKKSFINKQYNANKNYQAALLTNDKKEGKKFLSTLLKELGECDEFFISVAFVTNSGVATIINRLQELERNHVKGKFLVSQYLNFTEPEALRRLSRFGNITLKIATNDFHSKGYIFKHGRTNNIVIGSSNLTANALCSNKEWNLKVSSTDDGQLYEQVITEFDKELASARDVTPDFLDEYTEIWSKAKQFRKQIKIAAQTALNKPVTPNQMQSEALKNLSDLRKSGKNKALIISATGTGKTYLSAFDVQQYQPKTFLFIVHRRTIAEEALKTFRKLLGSKISMGLFSGQSKDLDCDYLFSTVQTISKQENLKLFNQQHFDYIVIDETHRAGAQSYKAILDYFKPGFLLGMTATPERTDGANIFELFDYNLAYEIRLHRALDEGMLSPFHYYGVTDITINNEVVNEYSDFNKLTSDERVNHIIAQSKFYGTDSGEIRGLVFCSSNKISLQLADEFNQRGYKSIALSGASSEDARLDAMKRLESTGSDKIDYIFTVDIFNEGIDIPSINQIIMLRPTQSAIIFVQQLGRGLRKAEGKEYLTVIDFIGNYNNNYLVPIALYGDRSFNKDTIRKLIRSGSNLIPGASTVNFDEIAREKIFESIKNANMQKLADLKKDYEDLKHKTGRIPMMMDFIKYGSRDPWLFASYAKSYLNFINRVEDSYKDSMSPDFLQLLELFTLNINNGKRVEESLLLRRLLEVGRLNKADFINDIQALYGYIIDKQTIESLLININFNFIRKSYDNIRLENGVFSLGSDLKNALGNDTFNKFFADAVDYSVATFNKSFSKKHYIGGLIRYNKYSRKDVCRLLNWEQDISSTVYGYKTVNGVTPCFVTYHKSAELEGDINYNDHFIDSSEFAWESRSNRKLSSPEIKNVIESKRILLFVKKEDGEGTDFYYLGNVSIAADSIEQGETDKGQPIVHFRFLLDNPVEDTLYDYLIQE
ncbi:DUF3427 domain-containing protein [Psychrobacter raelei]|uniref:DUF3427 domain-containing protein n=1 Tax=Psychrobacter raelei TaxID=2565531 RepID=UPI003F5F135E